MPSDEAVERLNEALDCAITARGLYAGNMFNALTIIARDALSILAEFGWELHDATASPNKDQRYRAAITVRDLCGVRDLRFCESIVDQLIKVLNDEVQAP